MQSQEQAYACHDAPPSPFPKEGLKRRELRAPAEVHALIKLWNTLGVAQYRAGDPQAALTALTKAMQLCQGGDANDWFFLAMAHWRLGEKPQARRWYDKAAAGMNKSHPPDGELRGFQAEAAALLRIQDFSARKGKEVSPAKK